MCHVFADLARHAVLVRHIPDDPWHFKLSVSWKHEAVWKKKMFYEMYMYYYI